MANVVKPNDEYKGITWRND